MTFTPRDYQAAAIEMFLRVKKCYWMLKPGAGKTGTALAALQYLFDDFAADRILVVGPKRVVNGVWQRDAAKWGCKLPMTLLQIPQKRHPKRGMIPAAPKATRALGGPGIDLVSKDQFPSLVKAYGVKRWPYSVVVWDEASGIKDHETVRFRAMKHLLPAIEYLLLLSGTPRPNSEMDLWPAIYLLDQGERLGRTLTAYRDRFFVPDKRSKDRIYSWRCSDPRGVHEAIADVCFAAKVEIEVPEQQDLYIDVEIPASVWQIYEDLDEHEISGNIVAANRAVVIGKQQQIAGGAVITADGSVRWLHDAKIKALRELVADGEPTIVCYWFQHELERLKQAFPEAEEFKSVDRWIDGEVSVMLLHPASAGHGIDGLQMGGHRMVWYSVPHSNELYQQTVARLVRNGSPFEAVQNYHLLAELPIDRAVKRGIELKELGQVAMMEYLYGQA